MCADNFFAWNFLLEKLRLFENVIKLLFISTTLSSLCEKSYEKTYLFFSIFSNFQFSIICSQNFMTSKLQKRIMPFISICEPKLVYCTKFEQYFWLIMKNPTICGTCFWSLFQVLHCHAVLSWPHICNKNGSCFNFAKKLLFISNSIFFTRCL